MNFPFARCFACSNFARVPLFKLVCFGYAVEGTEAFALGFAIVCVFVCLAGTLPLPLPQQPARAKACAQRKEQV